jgi:hypothetical protein
MLPWELEGDDFHYDPFRQVDRDSVDARAGAADDAETYYLAVLGAVEKLLRRIEKPASQA